MGPIDFKSIRESSAASSLDFRFRPGHFRPAEGGYNGCSDNDQMLSRPLQLKDRLSATHNLNANATCLQVFDVCHLGPYFCQLLSPSCFMRTAMY
ncbi:hypothetical protein J6590_018087 [Homalodisca vitripennis]|nr:hypothetical protein J6590_018087 [Homalodisca vitripennis]